MSNEVVKFTALDKARMNAQQLGELSFEDIAKLAQPGEVVDAAEALGDGFRIASDRDKERLVNVPFYIVDYKINPNGQFGKFATLWIITGDNRHLILNDGGQGVVPMIEGLKKSGESKIIFCKHGLSKSTYPVFEDAYESDGVTPVIGEDGEKVRVRSTNEKGEPLTGTTFRVNLESD